MVNFDDCMRMSCLSSDCRVPVPEYPGLCANGRPILDAVEDGPGGRVSIS